MAVAGGLVGPGLDVWRNWLVPLMRHAAPRTERFTNAAGGGPVSGARRVDSELAGRPPFLVEIDLRSGRGGIFPAPSAGCMASGGDPASHPYSSPPPRPGLTRPP